MYKKCSIIDLYTFFFPYTSYRCKQYFVEKQSLTLFMGAYGVAKFNDSMRKLYKGKI